MATAELPRPDDLLPHRPPFLFVDEMISIVPGESASGIWRLTGEEFFFAGALFVPQAGIINPSEMAPDKSLEAVVWCAVGGRGNLLGPILGAIGCNSLKSYATHAFAEQWPYILGGLFVFVTLFMPKGIIGLPEQLRELKDRFTRKRNGDVPRASPIEPKPAEKSATP